MARNTNKQKCHAHSKQRAGAPCDAWAMRGRTVCIAHGGKTPRGMASANYKHGRYSKDLPSRLASQYETAISDPELTSIRDEIGLAESRLHELLQRVEGGDAGGLWPALAKAKNDYVRLKGTEKEPELIDAMLALIDQGAQDWMIWRSIGEQIDRLARLRTAEHKRQVDMQLMISAERANLMIGAIIDMVTTAMRTHVGDDVLIKRVYADISRGIDKHITGAKLN